MERTGFHLLRFFIGITFVWIGILILQDPIGWSGYLEPWARNLLILPIEMTMMITGVFDVVVGVLFLLNLFVRWAGFLGALHIVVVLATSGLNEATIRDIGILGGTLALAFSAHLYKRFLFWRL
ncbi:MAG: DoxX family membrane protein [Patescibacteria group bacterium]